MVTPEHIKPVWYFTPFYAMLRAIPNKLFGVIIMGAAVLILLGVPWLDRSPVKSIRYRGLPSKIALAALAVSFVWLGWLGANPPSEAGTLISQILTFIYFAFFIAMPVWSRMGTTKPVPDRVTFGH
jgi:ubiquinol-cytochrome c reductase cytochrome b subunit